MNDILSKLNDPSIKWYIYKHFGYRVYGDITRPNQTLSICDDMICIPVRFNRYFMWWDRTAGAPNNRMFDLSEAWDHTNETNPNTSYPLNADDYLLFGYSGYFIAADLTNGSDRVVTHIVRKHNQLLIQNRGYYISAGIKYTTNIAVKVYFPPTSLNMTYQTNGTSESDGITITSGQYVLFYPSSESPYSINTTGGIFSTSPMGTSKSKDYELYIPSTIRGTVEIPAMYTGIRTAHDRETIPILLAEGRMAFGNRGGINVGGFRGFNILTSIYSNDPYASQGTWAEGSIPFTLYIGWAEDENENVKYILMSSIAFKHSTKVERQASIPSTYIYDVDSNETYVLAWIMPITNIWSYGQNGYVTHPFVPTNQMIFIDEYLGRGNPQRVIIVKPDDSVDVKTSPALNQPPYWEYNDGYGGCNVYDDMAYCFETLALYTDDGITINPKNMSVNRNGQYKNPVAIFSLQIKPFMDRTLYANKTYFVMVRVWVDKGGETNDYYASRIKKYDPKVISQSEWNALLTSLPPYSLNLIGGAPGVNRRYIVFNVNKTQFAPGETITITGRVRNIDDTAAEANRYVLVVLLNATTNTTVSSTQVTTDSYGNFTATIPAPSQSGTYKAIVISR